MYIYNVSIKVSWVIHENWLKWMQTEHIPQMLATGLFERNVLSKLIDIDEAEGPTFSCQYYLKNYEAYERYIAEYSDALRKEGLDRWGDQCFAFRSLMEVVN